MAGVALALAPSPGTFDRPLGFGVRQSSGALAWAAGVGPKAPEDWRSPRRSRADAGSWAQSANFRSAAPSPRPSPPQTVERGNDRRSFGERAFEWSRRGSFRRSPAAILPLPWGASRWDSARRTACDSSADFQSAVSQVSNLPSARRFLGCGPVRTPSRLEIGDTADWKSALRGLRPLPNSSRAGRGEGKGSVQQSAASPTGFFAN